MLFLAKDLQMNAKMVELMRYLIGQLAHHLYFIKTRGQCNEMSQEGKPWKKFGVGLNFISPLCISMK